MVRVPVAAAHVVADEDDGRRPELCGEIERLKA